jgi:hypothetical protein
MMMQFNTFTTGKRAREKQCIMAQVASVDTNRGKVLY